MALIEYGFLHSPLCNIWQVLPAAAAAAGAAWFLLRRRKASRQWAKTALAGYLGALAAILCTPAYFWETVWRCLLEGRPVSELTRLVQNALLSGTWDFRPTPLSRALAGSPWAKFMYRANVALFVPFGMLWPLAAGKGRRWWAVWLAPLAGGAVELVQPLLGRRCDADDFLCYLLGGLAGSILGLTFGAVRDTLTKESEHGRRQM